MSFIHMRQAQAIYSGWIDMRYQRARVSSGAFVQAHMLKVVDLVSYLGHIGFVVEHKLLCVHLTLWPFPEILFTVCCDISHEETGYLTIIASQYAEDI